mgnify:CR=1 FL=1
MDGRRSKEPIVEPMAVTTFGEMGPGCTLVQEWLAMRLKAHLLAQPARPDGRDPAKITGRFRADFRLAIMMVCARRAAAMQLGSGLPDASIRGLRLHQLLQHVTPMELDFLYRSDAERSL